MSGTPALDALDALLGELSELERQAPAERARRARDLALPLRRALGLVGDEAIALAVGRVESDHTRVSYQALADTLGMSRSRVNNAVTHYRTWLRDQA